MSRLWVQSVAGSGQEAGIPEGWESIALGRAVIYGKGKKPKKLSVEQSKEMVPYINIQAFEKGVINEYADIPSSRLIDTNDILVVWDGARFGLTGMGIKGAAGSTLMVLKPIICNPKYIFNFINRYYSYINSKPKGTGTPHVNPDIFWNLQFPIAPLNEQKRIVARLDKIIPRINKVKERLDKVPQIIKRFRQSVINNAVNGKLTEDWREKHPDVESAEILLERIGEDREDRYKKACDEAKKAAARKPKKYRENLTEITKKVQIKTWKWAFLSNISNITGGVTKGRNLQKFNTISLPYLRVANVQDGYLDLNEIKEIEIRKNEFRKYELIEGDILFTEGGDRDKLGRGCVWKNEIHNCIHQNHIFKARLNQNLIISKYVSFATKSEFSKAYFDTVANQTVNLASINMTNLGDLPILLPPLEEQKEIVRQVDKLFALAGKLDAHYQKAKACIDKLSQSVLAKAFRGELVMNEAELAKKEGREFESAEMLLERIKKEKAKMKAAMKVAKKPVGKKRRVAGGHE